MTPEALAAMAGRAYRHLEPWTAEQFTATLAQPGALLCTAPHAFVLGQVIADEAEVLALAADPVHQRSGQARQALMRFHEAAFARGAARVFLEVAVHNAPARALYTACGYQQVGLRKAYYKQPGGPNADAVVMSRALP